MVYPIKGEVQIGKGLGLPNMTTVQRAAYTPAGDGYKVFDTDLNKEFVYHSTQWNEVGKPAADLLNSLSAWTLNADAVEPAIGSSQGGQTTVTLEDAGGLATSAYNFVGNVPTKL